MIQTHEEKLNQTKSKYPFGRWEQALEYGMELYTAENCGKMRRVFDDLIAELIAAGETATAAEKIALFKIAIEATNRVDAETDGMVETGEREDLCELTNRISIAAGLNPDDYGGGEGLASEWRDW